MPVEPRLSQRHGFLHAGVVVAALDGACGYAALTLMPDDAEVLTVEFKVNLLAPATGDRVVAEGEVVRAGGTLTVCRGDAYAEQGSERAHVATMLAHAMVRRRERLNRRHPADRPDGCERSPPLCLYWATLSSLVGSALAVRPIGLEGPPRIIVLA